jgi:sugar phosphate isomerase/epimerase
MAAEQPSEKQPPNMLACRLANYGKFQDAAWEHLPSIGFKYVFINVPAPEEVPDIKARLQKHGLKVAVVRGNADLSKSSSVDELAGQCETCEKLGVKFMFLSPKHPGVDKATAYRRLRQAGDAAKKHGVIIALETHPDLGTNGDVHVETMKRIDHPNIRVNFDTGNVTFYNYETNAAAELQKCIQYVATVEFKDHDGGFETWNFPTIGKGAVDFPAVIKILKEHKYAGPVTMEVEGVRGVEMDEAQTKKYIEESAKHVRTLGEFD